MPEDKPTSSALQSPQEPRPQTAVPRPSQFPRPQMQEIGKSLDAQEEKRRG